MALNLRRGSASIEESANKKGGGTFRPFIPEIQWRNDNESKYVLVLTDIQEVVELLLHSFVPVGKGKKANGEEYTRYEDFLSRKTPAIGEDYDDLEDRLEREPKVRHMGVMVELEPVTEAGTTKKLSHFVAKTEVITRNTDDGEIEVTVPVVGLCTQSAQLMWGPLNNLYHEVGDLIDVPLSITRHGLKTNTRYDMIPFLEKSVDLAPVIDYLDGIAYIGDDLDDLLAGVEAADSDVAKAQVIADYLLNKRINELADAQRYEDMVKPLTLEGMPKNPWGRKRSAGSATSRPARPPRRSPRETVVEEEVHEEVAPVPSGKTERFAALKSRVEARG